MRPIEGGYPDRVCIFPDGVILFVEVKSQGKKPDPLQVIAHKELLDLGCMVSVVDTKASVDKLMETVCPILS